MSWRYDSVTMGLLNAKVLALPFYFIWEVFVDETHVIWL